MIYMYLFSIDFIKNKDWGTNVRFYHVPTINVLSKQVKYIKLFVMKFSIFTAEKISVFVMNSYRQFAK